MHNDPITRTLRKQGRNMTWLARQLGINRRTLYYRLRGERGDFSADERQRISDILDIPDEFLFEETPGLRHAPDIHQENVL